VLTLHRPSNVDDEIAFGRVLSALEAIGAHLPVVFPVHPRTRKQAQEFELEARLEAIPNIILCEPIGYLDFVRLMSGAKLVLTDSGGLQEETTALGIPCLTLRENTERPITVTEGTNIIVGNDTDTIVEAAFKALESGGKTGSVPELWDGRTAGRIADVLLAHVHRDG
jgi:UDP-N-acetylglucosamine 2-epimerase (non-hydrolysing)